MANSSLNFQIEDLQPIFLVLSQSFNIFFIYPLPSMVSPLSIIPYYSKFNFFIFSLNHPQITIVCWYRNCIQNLFPQVSTVRKVNICVPPVKMRIDNIVFFIPYVNLASSLLIITSCIFSPPNPHFSIYNLSSP